MNGPDMKQTLTFMKERMLPVHTQRPLDLGKAFRLIESVTVTCGHTGTSNFLPRSTPSSRRSSSMPTTMGVISVVRYAGGR